MYNVHRIFIFNEIQTNIEANKINTYIHIVTMQAKYFESLKE